MSGFIFATLGNVRNFRNVNFLYLNRKENHSLPAFVVSKYEKVTPVLFAPHSLSESDVKLIRELAQNRGAVVIMSPSFGFYNCEYKIEFQQLVFFYLYHFIKFYDFGSAENFFIDISVGLNQLTFAMLEAFRFLRVFSELSNLGKTRSEKPSFHMIYSEPIIGREVNSERFYEIYKEDFKPKAFISLPITWKDLSRVKSSVEKLPIGINQKREFIRLIENALYTVSLVLNNIPLAVYLLGYDPSESIRQFIKSFLKELEPILGDSKNPPAFKENNGEIIYDFARSGIEYKLISNSLLLIGFYLGVVKILEEVEIPYLEKKGVRVEELYKKFKRVYRVLFGENNKNEIILERDKYRVIKLLRGYQYFPKSPDMWIGGEEFDEKNGYRPVKKRDFLAHSGLLSGLIEANCEMKIRYKEYMKDQIKELLRGI